MESTFILTLLYRDKTIQQVHHDKHYIGAMKGHHKLDAELLDKKSDGAEYTAKLKQKHTLLKGTTACLDTFWHDYEGSLNVIVKEKPGNA